MVFFACPLWRAAHGGVEQLLPLVVWTFVLVMLGIVVSFYAFYAVFGDQAVKFDKLLNVVPVFVAIWAAAVGWLIHFKLSSKAHRTNNSFSIIMETRKSSEFLRHSERVLKHFPPGQTSIPADYRPYFPSDSLKRLCDAATPNSPANPLEVEMAEAINSLKYVLNYFEFMAVGIRAGDLDGKFIYDTIGQSVVGRFDRSQDLINYVKGPPPEGAGQLLAFIDLAPLCDKWRAQLRNDAAAYANAKPHNPS